MEFTEYTEFIESKLHKKGIDIKTQDYIIKYIYMNQKLFSRALDIDKVIDRIANNLNHNLEILGKSGNFSKKVFEITKLKGSWRPYENKIYINPLDKLKGYLSNKEKVKNDSTIMHELDHCATTEYIYINDEEKEKYVEMYFNRFGNKTNLKKQDINEMFFKYNKKLAISGISDARRELENGIYLNGLNEGITAYKQGKYDEFLGKKPYTPYKIQKKVAKFIGDTIGEEELINKHFNNDYEGIRTTFNMKTGKELNDLINSMNRIVDLKRNTLGPLGVVMGFKQIQNIIRTKQIERIVKKYSVEEVYEEKTSKEKSFKERLTAGTSLVDQARKSKEIQGKNKQKNENILKPANMERF